MGKKVRASLIDLDAKQYAILAPGEGYYKNLWGSTEFYDNLPRASGCFHSRDAALEKRREVIKLADNELQVKMRELNEHGLSAQQIQGRKWYVERAKETLNRANTSVVVEISLKVVS